MDTVVCRGYLSGVPPTYMGWGEVCKVRRCTTNKDCEMSRVAEVFSRLENGGFSTIFGH